MLLVSEVCMDREKHGNSEVKQAGVLTVKSIATNKVIWQPALIYVASPHAKLRTGVALEIEGKNKQLNCEGIIIGNLMQHIAIIYLTE